MDYYYETEGLQRCIEYVRVEMTKAYGRDTDLDRIIRDVIENFAARLRCEISYRGFRGLLVSEEQIWEKVQDREVAKMLDDMAEKATESPALVPTPPAVVKEIGPLTDAFKAGMEGKE